MSIFNPELKESREHKWEANKFSPEMQKKLFRALDAGMDRYTDIVLCPVMSCGNPLRITMKHGEVLAHCTNCGWEHTLRADQRIE